MVVEVAVVGLPDDRWGEVVTAYVVAKDRILTAEELDEFCKNSSNLSNFKRPRSYQFVEALPKSAVGKTLRRKLRDEAVQNPVNKRESVS
jgi:2-furoate---CoA ligase